MSISLRPGTAQVGRVAVKTHTEQGGPRSGMSHWGSQKAEAAALNTPFLLLQGCAQLSFLCKRVRKAASKGSGAGRPLGA